MEEFEQNQFQQLIDEYHQKRSNLADSNRWALRIGAAIGMILFLIVLVVLMTKMTQSVNIPFALPRAITLVVLVGGILLLVKDLGLVTESLAVCKEISGRIHQFLNIKPQVGQAVGAKFFLRWPGLFTANRSLTPNQTQRTVTRQARSENQSRGSGRISLFGSETQHGRCLLDASIDRATIGTNLVRW